MPDLDQAVANFGGHVFTLQQALERHVSQLRELLEEHATTKRVFVCPTCERELADLGRLRQHMADAGP